MGVPGFFLWLWKKYKLKSFIFNKFDIEHNKFISKQFSSSINNINELLIDANCLIHPQCFSVLDKNKHWTNIGDLENLMINEILSYIELLIKQVDPKDLVYIAIDGVAPTAKIKQQRLRRFKSVKDSNLYNNIKRKYGKEISKYWTNSSITPGTVFMEKLTKSIINHFKTNKHNCKVVFSSSNTPSEGEHKLLQYIRNKDDIDKKYVIYGLDADLLFLSLSSQKENIFLLREAQQMNNIQVDNESQSFNYVSIDVMKQCIYEEITSKLDMEQFENKIETNNIINDFVFICYLLGNDFIPHIPSLDIRGSKLRASGIDILIEAYVNVFQNIKEHIINITVDENGSRKITIHDIFINQLLIYVGVSENDFFMTNYTNTETKHMQCNSNDPYDLEIFRIDNLMFKINDPIELGKDTPELWKFRYYQHYFHCSQNQDKMIKQICHHYFEGLLWIAYYYFDKCPSWEWYYPYEHAPFISDMISNSKGFDFNAVQFKIGKPLKPFEQLLAVLPPQSSFLLPLSYKWLMTDDNSPIIYLYPISFELDMLYKNKYWQSIPFLPDIDIDVIRTYSVNIKLSITDIKRNEEIYELYEF